MAQLLGDGLTEAPRLKQTGHVQTADNIRRRGFRQECDKSEDENEETMIR